jgi:hypothetical protein
MPLVASIRNSLSSVGRKFADGVVEYRVLTSAPNATPRTFSTWTVLPYSRCMDFSEMQEQDLNGIWCLVENCILRVPYEANVNLSVRHQIRQGPTASGVSTSNIVWSVKEQILSGVGSVSSYKLYRKTPMLADSRNGGV